MGESMENALKMLVMDVDGTLTDGKIYMGDNGELMKSFNTKDGYAIHNILPKNNIIPVIITGRTSKIVENRCVELGIKYIYQGCLDKKNKMLDVAREMGLKIINDKIVGCAYIGDDVLDVEGMKISEIAGCPADSAEEIISVSDYICRRPGGCGAVREFVEWLVKQRGFGVAIE